MDAVPTKRIPKSLKPRKTPVEAHSTGSVYDFLALRQNEAQYFLLLVQVARAGSKNLATKLQKQAAQMKQQLAPQIVHLEKQAELTEAVLAKFYSHWSYSAIRVACSLPSLRSIEAIAQFLQLNLNTVNEAAEFLCAVGFCVRDKDGGLSPGSKATYLPPDSPYVYSHRLNWRTKVIEKLSRLDSQDLVFSAHLSLSKKDFAELREKFNELVREVYAKAPASPSEVAVIFNVDWVKL